MFLVIPLLMLWPGAASAQVPGNARGVKVPEPESAASRGRRWMVIIGIDDYREWPTLRNAVEDAAGFGKVMREKLGFSPVGQLLNEQATKHDILQLLDDDLRKQVNPDDDLVVFFAGHGNTRIDKVGGKEVETGFIIPFDARNPQEEQWSDYIQVDQFLEMVGKLPARHVLVILDACYSGFALGRAVDSFRGEARYEKDLGERVSRKVITSARHNQLASDRGPIAGHSLFTGALIDGIESGNADLDGDGVITSSELGLYLQQQVGRATASAQTPDYGSFYLDERGEMLLPVMQKPITPDLVRADKASGPRPSAAVLGFKNLSGASQQGWISTALTEMLRTEVGAGEAIRTIPGETVVRIEKELPVLQGGSFSHETLTTVYQNLGSDFIVSGTYLDMSGQIRVDVQVQNALLGETVSTFSETGTESNFFELVQRIGTALRSACGAGSVSAAQASAARANAPANTQAMQLYSRAIDLLHNYNYLTALSLLRKAVTADPQNALLRAALSQTLAELGYDDQARLEGLQAFERSRRLERRESLLIEAEYREATKEWDQAIDLYKSLWTFFPDDPEYGLRLATAQISAGKAQDSLVTLLALRKLPRPQKDDPRIDLAEASAAASLSDYRRQKILASGAMQKAGRVGAHLLAAQALLQQCQAQRRLGTFDEARKAAEQAAVMFRAANDLKSEAKTLTCIANSYADQGDYASAQVLHEKALALARQIGAQADIAGALINLGNLFATQEKIKESTLSYEQALSVATEIGDKRDAFDAQNNIAVNLMFAGDFTGAKNMLRGAAEAATAMGDRTAVAEAQLNLAQISYLQGEMTAAQQLFENSLSLAQEVGAKNHIATALRGLGDVLLARGSMVAAEKDYRESLVLRSQLGDKAGISDSESALAAALLENNNPSEACSMAQSAVEQSYSLSDPDQETEAIDVLIRCLMAQNNLSEANEQLAKAEKLNGHDLATKASLEITAARLLTKQHEPGTAAAKLDPLIAEMKSMDLLYYELQARLARAESEAVSGTPASAQAILESLLKDANRAGFVLIAQKAGKLR
jgi:tetratricopeptide (TPR) repeat protein